MLVKPIFFVLAFDMPTYDYEAVDPSGKRVSGNIDAVNEGKLKEELRVKGLLPLSISLSKGRTTFNPFSRATAKDILTFTQALGGLLEAGVPVDRALSILTELTEKEAMKKVLREVLSDLEAGQSLSQAISKHRVFPKLYANMIRAGETGGVLNTVIMRLASFLETTSTFRDEVISALIYPALLTVVGGSAITTLLIYVVPRFSTIFSEMGQTIPTATKILLSMSKAISDYWWLALMGIVLTMFGIRFYTGTREGRLFIDGLKLKIPLVKGLYQRIMVARFCRTLGTLIQSGVPILQAITISREIVGNEIIAERLRTVEEGIRKGRGVSGPMKESNALPALVAHMVAVGEEAGKLEDTLFLIADRYESESRNSLKRVISLLEPAMILFMGIVVGFIVVSMLLAIFSINEIPM